MFMLCMFCSWMTVGLFPCTFKFGGNQRFERLWAGKKLRQHGLLGMLPNGCMCTKGN
jgi:hypothetical protein